MEISSSLTLAGSSGELGAADVVGQTYGYGKVGSETPKAWSVLLAFSRRGIFISLRQLGDNMEDLRY